MPERLAVNQFDRIRPVMRFSYLLSLLLLNYCSLGLSEDATVFIRLASKASISKPLVTLADITDLTDVSDRLSEQFASIDLCRLERGEQVVLTREFIQLRLALNAFPFENVRLTGAPRMTVTHHADRTGFYRSIEGDIESAIAEGLQRSESDIRIRFLRPLSDLFDTAEIQKEALTSEVVFVNGLNLGRNSLDVRILNGRNVLTSRTVPVEVSVRQAQLRVVQPVERNQVIGADHVGTDVHFVTHSQESATYSDVVGRRTRRKLSVGDLIRPSDIEPVDLVTKKEIVVRPRDAIRLIAHQNNLRFVVPAAEALQSGEIGQVIRVRNLQSNRIVNARVVSHDEAVVDLH